MAWLSSLCITAKLGLLAGALVFALLVLCGTFLLVEHSLRDDLKLVEAEAAAASSPSPSTAQLR